MPPFPALCGLEVGDEDDAPSPTRGKAPPGVFCRRGGGERSPAPPPACGGTARRPARGRQPARASGFCVLRKRAAFPPSPAACDSARQFPAAVLPCRFPLAGKLAAAGRLGVAVPSLPPSGHFPHFAVRLSIRHLPGTVFPRRLFFAGWEAETRASDLCVLRKMTALPPASTTWGSASAPFSEEPATAGCLWGPQRRAAILSLKHRASPVLSPAQICRVASFLPGVGGENAHLWLYVSRQKAAFPPAAAGRLKSQLPARPVFPFFGGSAPRVKSKIIVYSPVSPFKTGTKYVK